MKITLINGSARSNGITNIKFIRRFSSEFYEERVYALQAAKASPIKHSRLIVFAQRMLIAKEIKKD
ncbi:MAG: hypothetical protein K1V95_02930 [Eubacterium sp.]